MSKINVSSAAVAMQFAKSNGNNTDASTKSKFNAKDYLDTRLKAGETTRKVKIRVLPVSATDENFLVELKTHSLKVDKKIAESGFKSFICLNDDKVPNYDNNTKCPLCSKAYELFKKAKELKQSGKTKEADVLYNRAKQLMNKITYILRVIDRAHEDEGVKFWRFNMSYTGKGILDQLRNIYNNKKADYKENGRDDNYNIFDLQNGRDIILTISRQVDSFGNERPAPAIDVDVSDFETPLTKDEELFEKWVNDPKKWYDAYATRTSDYLSIIADGEVPVRNSDGVWVAETVREEENNARKAQQMQTEKEAEKILEDTAENIKPEPKATVEVVMDDDDDDGLPF